MGTQKAIVVEIRPLIIENEATFAGKGYYTYVIDDLNHSFLEEGAGVLHERGELSANPIISIEYSHRYVQYTLTIT